MSAARVLQNLSWVAVWFMSFRS